MGLLSVITFIFFIPVDVLTAVILLAITRNTSQRTL